MADKNQKVVLWAGVGIAAATLVVGWLAYQRSLIPQSTPQGQSVSLPEGSAIPTSIYQPGGFNIPNMGTGTIGTSLAASPGSGAVFNFSTPPPIAGNTLTFNDYGGGPAAAPCGCGSSDGATGPCNAPGATTQAYGSPGAVAAAIGANLGPAITAAFSAGQQVRQQQNYDIMAGAPAGSALYVPPGPSLGFR